LSQTFLQQTTFRDVLHTAHHAHGLALFITNDEAAIADKGIGSVPALEAILLFPVIESALLRLMYGVQHQRMIIRVDVPRPG